LHLARRLVLVGHNGVGKSRLARYIAQHARALHFRVAWATCTRRDTEHTVLHSLISQMLDIKPNDDPAVLTQRLQELDLLGFADLLRALLVEEQGAVDGTTLLTLAVRLFASIPTVLIIDDAHRAQAGVLDSVKQILDAVSAAPLVTLLVCEPPFKPDWDAETHWITDLSVDELDRLAAQYLGVPALGQRLSALLWSKSGGRPIYAEAYLDSLIANGCIVDGELHAEAQTDLLPDGLREVVMTRVDALPAEAQSVLRAGAVLGEQFTPEALSVVSEMHDAARTRAVVQDLVDEQLLLPVGDQAYRFRRELVCSAIYSSLSRVLRLKLHRAAVNYWQNRRTQPQGHQSLAFHLAKCGLLPQAIEVLVTAAEEAEQRGDVERAVTTYRHALELFPEDKGIAARLEDLRQRLALD